MLIAVIDAIPGKFDSHQVIQELMTRYPREYVGELYEHIDDPDPILAGHVDIAFAIGRVSGVEADGEVESINVRGKKTKNKLWKKV
jgi:hypothetical protein